jgi:hypothetical protein
MHQLAPVFAGFLLGEVHELGGALLHAQVTLRGCIFGLSQEIVSLKYQTMGWPLTSA